MRNKKEYQLTTVKPIIHEEYLYNNLFILYTCHIFLNKKMHNHFLEYNDKDTKLVYEK